MERVRISILHCHSALIQHIQMHNLVVINISQQSKETDSSGLNSPSSALISFQMPSLGRRWGGVCEVHPSFSMTIQERAFVCCMTNGLQQPFPILTHFTLWHSWKEDEWQDKSLEHERGPVKCEWCVEGWGWSGFFRIYEWGACRHTQILTY